MTGQLTEDKVRKVIREEITSSDVISEIKHEVKKQGVLLEDLHAKFDKNIDLLTAQLNVKKQVDNHEGRLDTLETGQELLKSTARLRSQQLGAK